MLSASVTETIAIAAPPETVLDLVGDPRNLPRWAPGFAQAVREDGDGWIVDTGSAELRRHIPVSRESGTVDFLAKPGAGRGLFTRVVPNGDGSQLTFTFVLADGVDPDAQRAILQSELEAVKRLCER
jgi:polyketide cyclase/dehydrase/lipid transport protein